MPPWHVSSHLSLSLKPIPNPSTHVNTRNALVRCPRSCVCMYMTKLEKQATTRIGAPFRDVRRGAQVRVDVRGAHRRTGALGPTFRVVACFSRFGLCLANRASGPLLILKGAWVGTCPTSDEARCRSSQWEWSRS